MKIILQDKNELHYFNLTKEVVGNFWINDSKKTNLVNIEAENGKWVLKSNNDFKVLKNINYKENEMLTNINQIDKVELQNYMSFYLYEILGGTIYKIFCMPVYDDSMIQLIVDFSKNKKITIGNNKSATINCSLPIFSSNQLNLDFDNNVCLLTNNNTKISMYVNNILETKKVLSNGDMVFIEGISILFIGNILLINNPNNCIFYDSLKLAKRLLPNNQIKDYSTEQEVFVDVFNKKDYFQRPPRFKRIIEEKEFKIDPPTESEIKTDEMPMIYTFGPMMLMGITSIMSGFSAISNVVSGKSTFKANATPIITSISMLGGMLIFPLLQNLYSKTSSIKKEKKRRRKYKKYIEKKKNEILQEIEIQKQILIENNLALEDVAKISLNHLRTLWDRKIEHPDFLTIRLGIGSVKPKIKIEVPEEHFTMNEDNLTDVYNELFDTIKSINDVPVTINLIEKNITGFIGDFSFLNQFINGFMLQLLTYHSYDMLKIVVLTSSEKSNTWNKYINVPHFWNNDKSFRFIGVDTDDINKISNFLVQVYNSRFETLDENSDEKEEELKKKYLDFKEYYLIISDEIDYIKSTSIFNELIKQKGNLGFSMLLITETIDSLPNECSTFINLAPNDSHIFENELLSNNQISFVPDIANFNMNNCYLNLCNVPIDIAAGKFTLPKQYSFLEMYNVGNVNQLNILSRWKNNNIIQSLSAPVGINEQGELFKIDLHEKAHGPHGLVAGMTGSGKSEWIITYILSMCINYHPDEVQFVLIDYKGGGLAGTFENKETGMRLPHLAGTITNLDVSEINRSLASINSELKRRQALFNSARDKLGESSVDIYKYQRWYRESKIEEPISHLFIISDEFAELKSQQPEFMQELISTARIGRSLGVHLILATQKPNGVVDDQIWSNSKFRVCLKVQDKADSKDMIQIPDAALLKETGRFYLQVGYNEFFAKGQSAYAGGPYYESDRHKNVVDTDLVFIDELGEEYKRINSEKKNVSSILKGEELPNILKEIIKSSTKVETHVRKLWLDAIPSNIYINNLITKYGFKKENFILNPVIGEYDAPSYQKQALLTLPLSKNGNTLIYGMAGSGKENLLLTIIYSLMVTYYFQEVNVYILDFGAEILNCFKDSPIVGDIINSTNNEKIKNYFKFISEEFENRKKIFQEYNGDYYYYCSKSGNTLPTILTIINNLENFEELFGDSYDDEIIRLTREAEKYGIIFIITANSLNGVKYKLSQNFKQNICLQMNDSYDYKTIFGNGCKIIPASIKGRGIIKNEDDYFEFQSAYPVENDDLSSYIKQLSLQLLNKSNGKAKCIPTLPEKVDYNFISKYLDNMSNVPIGVSTDNLDIVKYNFISTNFNICTSADFDLLNYFLKSLVELISYKKDTLKAIIFDGMKVIEDLKPNVTCIKEDYITSLKKFNSFLGKVNEKTKQTLVIFTGFKNILDTDYELNDLLKTIFDKIKNTDKISVCFVDTINEINKYNSESIFRNNVLLNNAVYVGSGIADQYLIECKKITNEMREDIPDNFGYCIVKGTAIKFKYLEL